MAVVTDTSVGAAPSGPRIGRRAIGWALGAAALGIGLTVGISSGVCEPKLSTWVSLVTSGLTLGAIYAMIALGYTMVYGVLQLINFAHSEVFMIGTFAGLFAIKGIFGITNQNHPDGLSGGYLILVIAVGMVVASMASGGVAVLLERVAYRPLRKRGASRLGYLITAIGASLFLTSFFLLLDGQHHLGLPFRWPALAGQAPVSIPTIMHSKTAFTLLGVPIRNTQVLVVVVAVAMLIVLDLFVRKTRAGKGIRAVAEDPEMAALMGVSIEGIIVLTFLVGGLMAGGAGMLFGVFFTQTRFNVGFIPGIKAFTAAVLGGIGNIRGAMIGGILLGLIENVGVACTDLQWQSVIAFLVLVAVLMFKPTGLLGERVGS
jgi:branched-chain amino acid transport system permease protein